MPGGEQVFKGELDGISEEGQIVNKFNKAGWGVSRWLDNGLPVELPAV
jgi:hypothetical protein